jgi:thymidylate synthase (FAD)
MSKNLNFVLPKVFFIGATSVDLNSLIEYLNYTDQYEFVEDIESARIQGINEGEILCSFYAKLCYSSLTDKKNKNISKVRSISDNLTNILDTSHGSVIEHCSLNFVVTDCSRVFTHELVRHRVGTAFSQTSGRYVRNDVLKLVIDPILEPVYNEIEQARIYIQNIYKEIEKKLLIGEENFDKKKKLTSAMRRIMPNGQSNEIGFSVNLRTLRQTIEARTSRHAEWEIRNVFNQIFELVREKYPLIFSDSKVCFIDGLNEITFKNNKI